MPTAIEKTLDALLSGDLQGVNKKSTKTSHVRGTIKGFLPVKSKPKPPPISQPVSLLDPTVGDTNNTKEEAKAEKEMQPEQPRFDPVILPEDEDVLIDPTSTENETAILQPGQGGVTQPAATEPTGITPEEQALIDAASADPPTINPTPTQGINQTPVNIPSASSVFPSQAPGAQENVFKQQQRLSKLQKDSVGKNPQVKTLTDEERQTLLQSDILDVLLKTDAGRLLLGERRQKELQAERTLEVLAREPTKSQVRIGEIKFESDQLKRAAFPQLEALKVLRESKQFEQVNKSQIAE